MNTREIGTYQPAKWNDARQGDYIDYVTMNPWTWAVGDCVVVSNAYTDAKIVTGHVVAIDDSDGVQTTYEIRVNANHVGDAA